MSEPLDLDAIKTYAEKHTTRMVGLSEMYPECSCGQTPPCRDREYLLALVAEVERLREELARRDQQDAESLASQTGLRGLAIRDGVLTLDLVPPAELAKRMVLAARHMLGDAENYVEFEFTGRDDPDRFAFTVQRVALGKVTPHKAREAAEAERDRLRGFMVEAFENLEAEKPYEAESLLREVLYIPAVSD